MLGMGVRGLVLVFKVVFGAYDTVNDGSKTHPLQTPIFR